MNFGTSKLAIALNKSNKCHPEWPTEGRLYRRVLNEGHPSIRSLRLYLADQSLRMTLT